MFLFFVNLYFVFLCICRSSVSGVFASKVVVLLTYIYTQVQRNIHAEQKICFYQFICQTKCKVSLAITLTKSVSQITLHLL
jgi:hypothetical protein